MKKKSIIELGVTAVLIIILLVLISRDRRKTEADKTRPLKRTSSQEKISAGAQGESKTLLQRLRAETKDLELKRDPFSHAPIAPTKGAPFGLHLSGIAWDKENPRAIINEVILEVGDHLGGNTIVGIKQDRVILHDGTRYFELRLGQ